MLFQYNLSVNKLIDILLSHEAIHVLLRRLSAPCRWVDLSMEFDLRWDCKLGWGLWFQNLLLGRSSFKKYKKVWIFSKKGGEGVNPKSKKMYAFLLKVKQCFYVSGHVEAFLVYPTIKTQRFSLSLLNNKTSRTHW